MVGSVEKLELNFLLKSMSQIPLSQKKYVFPRCVYLLNGRTAFVRYEYSVNRNSYYSDITETCNQLF